MTGILFQRCEMCDGHPAPWHQFRPVERWLCIECADKDQRAAPSWHGEHIPSEPIS